MRTVAGILPGCGGGADYGCASRLLKRPFLACQGPFGVAVSVVSAGREFLGLVAPALLFRAAGWQGTAVLGALFFVLRAAVTRT